MLGNVYMPFLTLQHTHTRPYYCAHLKLHDQMHLHQRESFIIFHLPRFRQMLLLLLPLYEPNSFKRLHCGHLDVKEAVRNDIYFSL